MNWFQALVLGLIQGLTEYLPISSKTHIELGKLLMHLPDKDNNLMFTVFLHAATVLSTIVVFWKDILKLCKGFFSFNIKNEEFIYVIKIILSMLPVMIVGLLFKNEVEAMFTGNLLIMGPMMLVTAGLLFAGHYIKSKNKEITYGSSLIIGLAQAFAVLPGISRSGSTIATGLILGIKKEDLAKFSFLMVIIPVLGENVLEIFKGRLVSDIHVGVIPMIVGFVTAFVFGVLACKWMINIVKNSKLIYFAIYCLIVGLVCISIALLYK